MTRERNESMINEIVCDNSGFFALERITRLGLLENSFNQVIIIPAVEEEINLNLDLTSVKQIKNKSVIFSLNTQMDKGESEVIGTIGLLILRAKRIGLVDKVKTLLNNLQRVAFRLIRSLYEEAISLGKEKSERLEYRARRR